MLADLHVHTTASDGTDSPEEVVARAFTVGLSALAIADHDTLEGIQPAMEEGNRRNIEVIPGIELGTDYGGKEIHILGYMIDLEDRLLLKSLTYFRQTRRDRVNKIIKRLNRLGFPITRERVLEIAGSGSVGRPHIARAMVETGMVLSMEEAFDRYIGEGKPGFEPRVKCTPAQAVGIIIQSGGVPVLAHPGLCQSDELIAALLPEGLAGIEVHHPGHTPEMEKHYLKVCEQYCLLATGGSDYHGMENRKHNVLGARTVQYQTVERIKAVAFSNRNKAGYRN
ncbi:MAG: PHP domain-containing protein [Bacillota bacterium]